MATTYVETVSANCDSCQPCCYKPAAMHLGAAQLQRAVELWNAGEYRDSPIELVELQLGRRLPGGQGWVAYVCPCRRHSGGDLEHLFNNKSHSVLVRCFTGYTHTCTTVGLHETLASSLSLRRLQEKVSRCSETRGLQIAGCDISHDAPEDAFVGQKLDVRIKLGPEFVVCRVSPDSGCAAVCVNHDLWRGAPYRRCLYPSLCITCAKKIDACALCRPDQTAMATHSVML